MKIRSWQWVIGRKPERSVLGPPGYSPLTGAVVVDMAMLPMSALPPKADINGYGEWTDVLEENWTYEF